MPRQIISTTSAPSSPLYSQGVRTGTLVLVSGTTGTDPTTGDLAGPTIQEQTRQAFTNCEAILHAGGATLDDVVDVGILLADPNDFGGMNEEYARWFQVDPPTRCAAKLGAEVPGLLVSIRMGSGGFRSRASEHVTTSGTTSWVKRADGAVRVTSDPRCARRETTRRLDRDG